MQFHKMLALMNVKLWHHNTCRETLYILSCLWGLPLLHVQQSPPSSKDTESIFNSFFFFLSALVVFFSGFLFSCGSSSCSSVTVQMLMTHGFHLEVLKRKMCKHHWIFWDRPHGLTFACYTERWLRWRDKHWFYCTVLEIKKKWRRVSFLFFIFKTLPLIFWKMWYLKIKCHICFWMQDYLKYLQSTFWSSLYLSLTFALLRR